MPLTSGKCGQNLARSMRVLKWSKDPDTWSKPTCGRRARSSPRYLIFIRIDLHLADSFPLAASASVEKKKIFKIDYHFIFVDLSGGLYLFGIVGPVKLPVSSKCVLFHLVSLCLTNCFLLLKDLFSVTLRLKLLLKLKCQCGMCISFLYIRKHKQTKIR